MIIDKHFSYPFIQHHAGERYSQVFIYNYMMPSHDSIGPSTVLQAINTWINDLTYQKSRYLKRG